MNGKIVELGGAGRFATWPIPINMVFVEAGVELAVGLVKKTVKADDMNDVKAVFDKVISQKVSGYGLKSISKYPDAGNYYLVICDSVIFGKTQF